MSFRCRPMSARVGLNEPVAAWNRATSLEAARKNASAGPEPAGREAGEGCKPGDGRYSIGLPAPIPAWADVEMPSRSRAKNSRLPKRLLLNRVELVCDPDTHS